MTDPQQPETPPVQVPLDPWGQPSRDPWAPAPATRGSRRNAHALEDGRAASAGSPEPRLDAGVGSPLEGDRRRLGRVAATGGGLGRAVRAMFTGTNSAGTFGVQAAGVQAPVTTGRRVAVVSTRGGAGTTTAAALLGRVFSTLRPDTVCVFDLDPGHGSLGLRLGADGAAPIDNLVGATTAGALPSARELAGMLAHAAPNLFTTGARAGAPAAANARTASPEAVRECTSAISRYFPLTLLDCPTGLDSPATQAVLADCHAAIYTVPATLSGIEDALAQLRRWVRDPRLSALPLTVLVMQQDKASALRAIDQAARLSRLGFDAYAIGYDRHLAAGAELSLPLMLPAHRAAATAIAARVLEQANGVR